MRGTVRTPVEATPTAPPTAFFPCNLCAYLWPDICLPAAIYGGRDNSNKGGCHHGGLALVRAPFPKVPTSRTKQSFSKYKFSKLSCCCSGGKCSFSLVEKGKRCVNVLFPDQNSRSAARLAAFRQINKFPLFLDGSRLQSAMIMLMKPGLMSAIQSVIRQTINRRR